MASAKLMDLKLVFRVQSYLLLFEVFFMLIAALVGGLYGESSCRFLLYSAGFTALFSIGGLLATPGINTGQFGKREGYLIVSSVWIIFSFFGMLPFWWSGYIPSITDAYFETMSGFTTTGATILNDIEIFPHCLLFWRSIIQWIGGMGIIVMSVAILPLLGLGGMSLFAAEVPGITKDKLTARVSSTARILWGMYMGVTGICALSLWLAGMSLFDAVCHSFTTVATGGFSTKNTSLAYWNSPVLEYVTTFFMFISGINFNLYFFLLKGRIKKILSNEELRYYTLIVLSWSVLIVGSMMLHHWHEMQLHEAIRYALFNVVSLMTSTGYVSYDFMQWNQFIWTSFMMVMLFGGCTGSTAGGIKIARVTLMCKNSYYGFKRLIYPNAVIPVRYNNEVVRPETMNHVLAFIFLYFLLILVGMLQFTSFGLGFDESLGSAISTIGNVGPALGDVGPTSTFAGVPASCKWYMSFLMLVGRLELFTVLMLFTPAFWKK